MGKPEGLRRRATNFSGRWDDVCPHCGLQQETHRTLLGEVEGELLEHRRPCEPEKAILRRESVRLVRTANLLAFLFWVVVPFVIIVLEETNPLVARFALVYALFKLGVEGLKLFGTPKWIPGHKARTERERRMEHYFYHCERNPEGFARLRAENFAREEQER
jgi:hypothetical protein